VRFRVLTHRVVAALFSDSPPPCRHYCHGVRFFSRLPYLAAICSITPSLLIFYVFPDLPDTHGNSPGTFSLCISFTQPPCGAEHRRYVFSFELQDFVFCLCTMRCLGGSWPFFSFLNVPSPLGFSGSSPSLLLDQPPFPLLLLIHKP